MKKIILSSITFSLFLFSVAYADNLKEDQTNATQKSFYAIEKIVNSDSLRYRGASLQAVEPYRTKGYLIDRAMANCPPCGSPDPSLCAPCPSSSITLAASLNATREKDRLMVSIDDINLQKKILDLALNQVYEFTLKPGQNHPDLVSVDVIYKSYDDNSGNDVIYPPTPEKQKQSFVAKFISWFFGLFRKN